MPRQREPETEIELIKCPECACGHHRVIQTRHVLGTIKRRRECRNCLKEFWTTETAPPAMPRKLEGIPPGSTDTSF